MVGGPSIVFTRKAVVDETLIRDSGKICKSIVGIDASQLYPYSMCQPMPTGLDTRWEYDTESNRFKPQQNKSNSSYGYQIMDRNRHPVTKYLNDGKTHGAINTKFFKRLDHINDQFYEVELAKAEIEQREPIIVGFFILQYAKLRMLELYYNFFERFCDVNKFEELEMDTDSLYLALSEKELYDCIREESKAEWAY